MTRNEQKQLDKLQDELAQASHEASARGTEPSEDPLVVSLEARPVSREHPSTVRDPLHR